MDQVTPPGATPPGATPPNQNPGGADPSKNGAGAGTGSTFDPSKLSDDDLAKLYDDPRLYKHDRFKQLNERAKKAKEYEDQEAERQRKEMEKKGEFEKLANQHKEEAQNWKTKYSNSVRDNALLVEATKKGVQYPDAALKLIDTSKVVVNDDGTVTGVTEAVDAAVKAYPTLLTINRSTTGPATNPGNPGSPQQIKMSQLSDPKFYRENQAAIQQAIREGSIIEDRFQR